MEVLIYVSLIFYLLVYLPSWWGNTKAAKRIDSFEHQMKDKIDCTLIVPLHNEAENLANLVKSLALLNPAPTEIILVDDYSTDLQEEVGIREELPNMKWIRNTNERGKKNALSLGIEEAKNDLIVTTDADCKFHPLWVGMLVGQHLHQKNTFTFGLVDYSHSAKWIEYYQWMENRALMAVGVGMFQLGYPIMCNGANLVFHKSAWQQVNGYEGTGPIQGGDDIFLMHKIWKNNKEGVGVCLEPESRVVTKAHTSFKAFMKQRSRWIKKTGKYKVKVANFFPVLVGLANVLILGTFIFALSKALIYPAIALLIAKAVIDYVVISSLKKAFVHSVPFPMLLQFQLFQLIYPFLLPFYKSDWNF